jgi:hypothetical protein
MDLKYFLKFSFKVKMIFRCSGIPVFRHSGVPAFRCSGIQVFWHSFFYYMPSLHESLYESWEARVCTRVDESWEARVCMRVDESLLDITARVAKTHQSLILNLNQLIQSWWELAVKRERELHHQISSLFDLGYKPRVKREWESRLTASRLPWALINFHRSSLTLSWFKFWSEFLLVWPLISLASQLSCKLSLLNSHQLNSRFSTLMQLSLLNSHATLASKLPSTLMQTFTSQLSSTLMQTLASQLSSTLYVIQNLYISQVTMKRIRTLCFRLRRNKDGTLRESNVKSTSYLRRLRDVVQGSTFVTHGLGPAYVLAHQFLYSK